jgi:hypothetical protein
MIRIIQIVVASGLPTTAGKSEVLIHPLITWGLINRREQQKSMK